MFKYNHMIYEIKKFCDKNKLTLNVTRCKTSHVTLPVRFTGFL